MLWILLEWITILFPQDFFSNQIQDKQQQQEKNIRPDAEHHKQMCE